MSETSKPTGNGHYDLAVIGAGSAGFSAAITAAEIGAQVLMVGDGTIGGTCVNVGCIPSKTLIRAAQALHDARNATRFAGLTSQAKVDHWRALVDQKDSLVGALRQAKYADLLPEYNGIAYVEGRARLTSGGVAVGAADYQAEKIIVATGSTPDVPAIEGLETVPYLTSTTAMDLRRLPKSLIVIGGGYVGCELGQMFARVGVEVTIVCRHRLLPDAEPEIANALKWYLSADGVVVKSDIVCRSLAKVDAGIALTFTDDGQDARIEAEAVLVATGRRPITDGMDLEAVGVKLGDDGAIVVDDRMRTTRAGTYAAGDVTGRDPFVFMAAYGARIAAENALNGDGRVYDASAAPSVVFTDPQVASVGLTEAAARNAGHKVKSSILMLGHLPRALAARDTRGLIKLVADDDGRLLGAHILAPEGADSIQTAALAIKQGLSVRDLADMVFPYLTTVEGLKLAAQSFDKDVSKLSCCAG